MYLVDYHGVGTSKLLVDFLLKSPEYPVGRNPVDHTPLPHPRLHHRLAAQSPRRMGLCLFPSI